MDAARKLPQLLEGLGELLTGAFEQLLRTVRVGSEPVLRKPERQRQRDEPLLRAVVEVALELAPLLVAGGDDARARRLELFLLALPLGDLAHDHQELVLAARSEPRFVVAGLAG